MFAHVIGLNVRKRGEEVGFGGLIRYVANTRNLVGEVSPAPSTAQVESVKVTDSSIASIRNYDRIQEDFGQLGHELGHPRFKLVGW